MKRLNLSRILILDMAMSLMGFAGHLDAQTYTVVHKNGPWGTDGCCQDNPGLLAEGIDGNIYGTNPSQLWGYGTVTTYSPTTGTFSVANFPGAPGGDTPQSGLTLGVDGYLYGTTLRGGTAKAGTVFRTTGGVPSTVYSFTNGTDGAYPWAPPIQTPDGNLWGVTYNGNTPGTVYKITPTGTLSWVGKLPYETQAPMIIGADGNLYGTTPYGDGQLPNQNYNRGTVFQLTPAGVIKVLHSFNPNNAGEGLIPVGPVMQGADGYLYGTTYWGGSNGLGTVFRMKTDGTSFLTLHSFTNNVTTAEGDYPAAGLVQGSDGYLYGVTNQGGSSSRGTLFKIGATGSGFAVLHNFDASTGSTPLSTPFLHTNGKIYGTTSAGGSGYGVLYSFDAGLQPFANLVSPRSGSPGTIIEIIGQGFNNATAVSIGGYLVPKWDVQVASDTLMFVTVPVGARTGHVVISEYSVTLTTPQTITLPCTRLCIPTTPLP